MGDSTLVGRGESRERGAAYNQENSEKEQPPASKQQGPRIPNICVSGGQLNISNWTSSENSIAVLCLPVLRTPRRHQHASPRFPVSGETPLGASGNHISEGLIVAGDWLARG